MYPLDHLPPRLGPDEPLPPYACFHGRFPHPLHDPRGPRRDAARRNLCGKPRYLGLELAWLIDQARKLEQNPVVCPAEVKAVRIVFGFCLLPTSV
jgi:hypothetical protein